MTTPNPVSQLSYITKKSVSDYLNALEYNLPSNLYNLVLSQVEPPLLEAVLEHTKGNQTNAARLLGISRGTLRTKLRYYKIEI